jgi:Protein of unknown function (DUF3019)
MTMHRSLLHAATLFWLKWKLLFFAVNASLMLFASPSLGIEADAAQLTVKPARCIALHEGQTCYQTLKMMWSTSVADSYCFLEKNRPSPSICWDDAATGKGTFEFSGITSSEFQLIRKRDSKIMAEFNVEVAWVYDASSHRMSHWRIF